MQFYINGEYYMNERWTLQGVSPLARDMWELCSRVFDLEEGWRAFEAPQSARTGDYPDRNFSSSSLLFTATRSLKVKGLNCPDNVFISIPSLAKQTSRVLLTVTSYRPGIGELVADALCHRTRGVCASTRREHRFMRISGFTFYQSEYVITADPAWVALEVIHA